MTNTSKVMLLSLITALTAGVVSDSFAQEERAAASRRGRRKNTAIPKASPTTGTSSCEYSATACLQTVCGVDGSGCVGRDLEALALLMSANPSTSCVNAVGTVCKSRMEGAVIEFQNKYMSNAQLAKSNTKGSKSCVLARMTLAKASECKNEMLKDSMNYFKEAGAEQKLAGICGSNNVYVDDLTSNANPSFAQGTTQVLLGSTDDVASDFAKIGGAGIIGTIDNFLKGKFSTKSDSWKDDVESVMAGIAAKASAVCGSDNMYYQSTVRGDDRQETIYETAVNAAAAGVGEGFGESVGQKAFDALANPSERKAGDREEGSSSVAGATIDLSALVTRLSDLVSNYNSEIVKSDRAGYTATFTKATDGLLNEIADKKKDTTLSTSDEIAIAAFEVQVKHFKGCAEALSPKGANYKYKPGAAPTACS
jgi:hypothetical protein